MESSYRMKKPSERGVPTIKVSPSTTSYSSPSSASPTSSTYSDSSSSSIRRSLSLTSSSPDSPVGKLLDDPNWPFLRSPVSPPPTLVSNSRASSGSSYASRTNAQLNQISKMPAIREDGTGGQKSSHDANDDYDRHYRSYSGASNNLGAGPSTSSFGVGNNLGAGLSTSSLGLADVAHTVAQNRRSRVPTPSFYQYGEDYLTSYARVGVPERPTSTPPPSIQAQQQLLLQKRMSALPGSRASVYSPAGSTRASVYSPAGSARAGSRVSLARASRSFSPAPSFAPTIGAPQPAMLAGHTRGPSSLAGSLPEDSEWGSRRGSSALGRVMGRDLEKGSVGGSEMGRPLVNERLAEKERREASFWRRHRRALVMLLVVLMVTGAAVGLAFGLRQSGN